MCSEIAIKVESLSKCYSIYAKPRDRLMQMLSFGRKQYFREFWALKKVSFEIFKGETIGIIGVNGSGKSTLLQLICGTLNPSSGSIQAKGRIAALLELGSGFNPEFSGRENIFVNGSILGLSREEICTKFEDIVAFADIGDFIDQPVKTYSSGMAVRLAFAVAIHTNPDILIVDEALSVGDIAFRNKCMERINAMVTQGVTLLFVTHDLSTLQLLCTRVLWLDRGELRAEGDAVTISQDYYVAALGDRLPDNLPRASIISQQETGKAQFVELKLVGEVNNDFAPGQTIRIIFSLLAKENLSEIVFAVSIYRSDGDWLIGQTSLDSHVVWPNAAAGALRKGELQLSPLCLAPGEYRLAMGAYSSDYALCYALTDLTTSFSIRAPYPTWGKIIHPCRWIVYGA